jgi:hypothetical protein
MLVPPVEIAHRWILLADPLEKCKYRISLARQLQLGIDVHIEIQIIAQQAVIFLVHFSKTVPAGYSPARPASIKPTLNFA